MFTNIASRCPSRYIQELGFDQDILKLNEGHEMLLYHLNKLVIMNKNVKENKKYEMPDNTMENIEKNNTLPERNMKNSYRIIEKDSDKNRVRTFGRGTVRRGTVRRKKNVSFG